MKRPPRLSPHKVFPLNLSSPRRHGEHGEDEGERFTTKIHEGREDLVMSDES